MASTRASSSRTATSKSKTTKAGSSASSKPAKTRKNAPERVSEESVEQQLAVDDDEDPNDDEASLHSDALDEDDDPPAASNKRKRGTGARSKKSEGKKKASPRKKRKPASDDEEEDLDLEEGQEVVGVVVQAPKTGRVPPGQISQNTFDFLCQLMKPECNDRQWFKLHEPVWRQAENEWKDFVESFTDVLVEKDPQIPHLPAKDLIYRIYRDVRFKSDKTPYKTSLSASFSRSGRKGIFAGYHVVVRPGGNTMFAAGVWQPGKNELQTLRNNIVRSSARLRKVISAPKFVGLFGEPKPHPQGFRQNIFGCEDELKVAPKGIDKTHKDIDLLKCRSIAVMHWFTDKQVLDPDFKEELGRLVKIMRPLVHCLNDMMTIPSDSDEEADEDEEDGDEEEEEDD